MLCFLKMISKSFIQKGSTASGIQDMTRQIHILSTHRPFKLGRLGTDQNGLLPGSHKGAKSAANRSPATNLIHY